ncbi:hypothetical protein IMCC1989_1976 [gamma proteobacterium IMCC1989]|nr:hypothetical protein IMCC1989_1976 [gamma proteobacterium IMCC1989]
MIKIFIILTLLSLSQASIGHTDITSATAKETKKTDTISFAMKKERESPSLVKVSLVFMFGIFLIFSSVFLLKKYVYKSLKIEGKTAGIDIIESKRITMKLTIHRIKIDNEYYLLAEKGDSLVFLQKKDSVL